jgi:hypothetical protein
MDQFPQQVRAISSATFQIRIVTTNIPSQYMNSHLEEAEREGNLEACRFLSSILNEQQQRDYKRADCEPKRNERTRGTNSTPSNTRIANSLSVTPQLKTELWGPFVGFESQHVNESQPTERTNEQMNEPLKSRK